MVKRAIGGSSLKALCEKAREYIAAEEAGYPRDLKAYVRLFRKMKDVERAACLEALREDHRDLVFMIEAALEGPLDFKRNEDLYGDYDPKAGF